MEQHPADEKENQQNFRLGYGVKVLSLLLRLLAVLCLLAVLRLLAILCLLAVLRRHSELLLSSERRPCDAEQIHGKSQIDQRVRHIHPPLKNPASRSENKRIH